MTEGGHGGSDSAAARPLPRRVVVVGCGRLGSLLAGRLSALGCEVVAIDPREAALERLPAEFSGFRVSGDAAELALLRACGVEGAECLVATTHDDNLNLLVAQVARTEFRVPRVLARVFDPAREKVYSEFGLTVVSPTGLAVDAFLDLLGAPGGVRP